MSGLHVDLYKDYLKGKKTKNDRISLVKDWSKLKKVNSIFFSWLYYQGYSVWNLWVSMFPDSFMDMSGVEFTGDSLVLFENYNFTSGTIDFTGAVFRSKVSFSHRCFLGSVYFRKAYFHDQSYFSSVIFKKNVYFKDAVFIQKDVVFNQSVFEYNANFSGVNFGGSVDFNKSTFKKDASFKKIKSTGIFSLFNFQHVKVDGSINFTAALFDSSINFNKSIFNQDFTFKEVCLTEHSNAILSNCRFKGVSNFDAVNVKTGFVCKKSIFEDIVSFDSASFSVSDVLFNYCRFDSNVYFSGSKFSSASFSSSHFMKSSYFKNINVSGGFDCVNSVFSDDVSFDKAAISGTFNLSRTNFDGLFSITSALFSGEVNLSHSLFQKDLLAQEAVFSGEKDLSLFACVIHGAVNFSACNFQSRTNFSRIQCFSDVFFDKSEFLSESKQALFRGSLFSGAVSFTDCSFCNIVNFLQAVFKKEADFSNTKFLNNSKDIFFQNVIFEDEVSFEKSVFSGGVNFFQAVFNRDSIFDNAQFQNNKKNVVFKGAFFEGNLSFKNVLVASSAQLLQIRFKKDVFFNKSNFSNENKALNFKSTVFEGLSVFDGVSFNGHVDFHQTIFKSNASFIESCFLSKTGKVDFSDAVFFKNATFKASSIFGLLDFSKVLFKKEVSFVRIKISNPENTEYFKDSVFEEGVSFKDAEFASEADFQHARFKLNLVLDNILCKSFNFAYAELVNTKFKFDKEHNKEIKFDFYGAKLEKVDMLFNRLNMVSYVGFNNAKLKDTDIIFMNDGGSKFIETYTKISMNHITGNSNISFQGIYFADKDRQTDLNNSIFDSLRFTNCRFKNKHFVMHKSNIQSSFNLDVSSLGKNHSSFHSIDLRYCCFNGILDISERVLGGLREVIDLRDTKISNVPFFENLSYSRYNGFMFNVKSLSCLLLDKVLDSNFSAKFSEQKNNGFGKKISNFFILFFMSIIYLFPFVLRLPFLAGSASRYLFGFIKQHHVSLLNKVFSNIHKLLLSSVLMFYLTRFLIFWYDSHSFDIFNLHNLYWFILNIVNLSEALFQYLCGNYQEILFSFEGFRGFNIGSSVKVFLVYYFIFSSYYFIFLYVSSLLVSRNEHQRDDHSKLCRLKSLAYKNQEHELALRFTAHEHNAKRFVKFGFLAALLDYFMGILCNYGRSIIRPFVCLVLVTLVSYGHYDSVFQSNPAFYKNIKYETPLVMGSIFSSLAGNSRNHIRQDLYNAIHVDSEKNNCDPAVSPNGCSYSEDWLRLDIMLGVQTIVSLFFIFMIGLGLRNRYKI